MPSPLNPSMVAVTTTSVSLPTKLRMQRSFLEPSAVAIRSNLRALAAPTSSRTLQRYCSSERWRAMVVVLGEERMPGKGGFLSLASVVYGRVVGDGEGEATYVDTMFSYKTRQGA